MKALFLNSAAAAVIVLGMSAMASAQSGGATGGSVGGGSQMQSPSGAGGAAGGASGGMSAPGAGAAPSVSGDCPPGSPSCTPGGAASTQGERGGGAMEKNVQGETKGGAMERNAQDDMKGGDRKSNADTGKQDMQSGRAAASKDLSTEQRTTIREKIVTRDVQRVNLDVNVSVGVAIPRTVTVLPLPADIVEIVPEYSGYSYIVLADGRIVIVDPATYQVVTILVV